MDDELLSFKDVTSLLKISERTLIKILQEESVPARKIGKQWRFSKQALIAWVAQGDSRDYSNRTPQEDDDEED